MQRRQYTKEFKMEAIELTMDRGRATSMKMLRYNEL